MDNKEYEIRRDFTDGEEVLFSLSSEDRETVESAIGVSDATVATCANASHSRQNPLEAA